MVELRENAANEDSFGRIHRSSKPAGNAQRSGRLIAGFFVAAGVIYLALFVYTAVGASILEPYSDWIDLVDDYFRAVDQGAPLAYLFDPHNLHRIPWLRGLIAVDVGVFRGTGLPFVAVAAICLIGTAIILMIEVRRAAGGLTVPLVTLAGMLVFLTANAGGVSVPANTPHLHATFFSMVALTTAASAGDRKGNWLLWAAAATSAGVASFSLAPALVLWPILVLMAWRSHASWWLTVAVLLAGGAFCAAYLTGQSIGEPIRRGLDAQGLAKAAEYFLAYMGLPWVRGSRVLGEVFGAALLLACLFALGRYGFAKANRAQRLALGMILFSIGGAALAAVGRRDIAVEVDVPVRYAILLAPMHIGLLMLAAPAIVRARKKRPRFIAGGLLAALALMMAQQVLVGVVVVRAAERARQTIALYHAGGRTPEMLQWIYPDLAHAEAVFTEMRRRGVFLQWVGAPKTSTRLEPENNSASSSGSQAANSTGAYTALPEAGQPDGEAP